MSDTSELKRCSQCGGPIPAEAPQGLCPKCLLLQASAPTEAGRGVAARGTPPTRDEVAAAFPQLEILELIGQGGMGFVFKARQPKLDRLVALKILPQSLAADPAFAERFGREGRMLARLNHPNIVTIHDFGQANGFFYLLMEFVDGVNLRQAMKVGRFTPAQALAIVPRICEALQFAHNEGILHRDIKPANILIDLKGRVKIADFGIAKLMWAEDGSASRGAGAGLERGSASRSASGREGTVGAAGAVSTGEAAAGHRPALLALTGAGKTLGTPQYMAPEQLEHPQDVDQRADIYSLGVVFYEMLTGELPIGKFALPSEKSHVDPRVDEVVLRTLEKERERRTQSAGEVKTQVETIAATEAMTGTHQAEQPFRASWVTWSPFQSPEVREICAHMTNEEKADIVRRGAFWGVWCAVSCFAFIFGIAFLPHASRSILAVAFVLVQSVVILVWLRMQRQFLCSTAWARERGLTPNRLKLFGGARGESGVTPDASPGKPSIEPSRQYYGRYFSGPMRLRDRWVWDPTVAWWFLLAPVIITLPLIPLFYFWIGWHALWLLAFDVGGLAMALVYVRVGVKVRRLKTTAAAATGEVAEALIASRTFESPGVAILRDDVLELVPIVGTPIPLLRKDIVSVREVTWFNGNRLWTKTGLILELAGGARIGVALPRPIGQRWKAVLSADAAAPAGASSAGAAPRELPAEAAGGKVGYLALGLFLAGTLGTVLLMTISYRHELALIFGGLALVLSLVFGVMGRRERLGRLVLIANLIIFAGLVLLLAMVIPYSFIKRGQSLSAEEARMEQARKQMEVRRAIDGNRARAAARESERSFGPANERMLESGQMFDFDSNELVSGVEAGADLSVSGDRLFGWDMLVVRWDEGAWDLPAAEITKRFGSARYGSRSEPGRQELDAGPITYVFRTREGGLGMLQVPGPDASRGGVKIRYKLVQNGDAK